MAGSDNRLCHSEIRRATLLAFYRFGVTLSAVEEKTSKELDRIASMGNMHNIGSVNNINSLSKQRCPSEYILLGLRGRAALGGETDGIIEYLIALLTLEP
ncbi:MAG: hypothetical protein QF577_08210 [Phycisphaerae bacterium]|jgi:hypothetical protein|nr:hypothetical protein [Phycisphaerae bacterium]